MEPKQGIEGIQGVEALLVEAIILGAKIAEKGVNADDLQYADDVIALAKKIHAFAAKPHDLVAEAKDLDSVEIMALLVKGFEDFKKVKEAL